MTKWGRLIAMATLNFTSTEQDKREQSKQRNDRHQVLYFTIKTQLLIPSLDPFCNAGSTMKQNLHTKGDLVFTDESIEVFSQKLYKTFCSSSI